MLKQNQKQKQKQVEQSQAQTTAAALVAAETGLSFIEGQNHSRRGSRAESPSLDASAIHLQYKSEMESMAAVHNKQIAALNKKESNLFNELLTSNEDLQKERYNHLDTLKDLTASKKRARDAEK